MEKKHQLEPHLKRLKLSGMLETLEVRTRQAIEAQIGYLDYLGGLLLDEVERRQMGQLQRRLKKAGFSTSMTLTGFDFGFNPGVNRQQVLDLATCSFVERKENLFFIGPAGVGKTHLASAIAHEACRKGYEVLFIKASQAAQRLAASRGNGTFETRFASFLKPDLLILDDWGLKPFDAKVAEDFYDIICDRYEKGSLVLTTNRSPKEWPELFGDALLASAAMDRLVHHATAIVIQGQSYRIARSAPSLRVESTQEPDGEKGVSS